MYDNNILKNSINRFKPNITSNQIYNQFYHDNSYNLKIKNIEIKIAGRIIQKRIMGKSSFLTIQDNDGKIQIYVKSNNFSETFYSQEIKKWHLGNIIGVTGTIFKTQTGELSIYSTQIQLLTKSIRSLPNKFHGLSDPEKKYRQRYLDLISNKTSRDIFKMRSKILINIRNFMIENNFIEVETPMMQNIPGGASARPFITHHNTLDINLYLRISPELYLKRLVIGGFDRIFEINRNFRNEGISTRHNPEFTMMELYMSYGNYEDAMLFTEQLFNNISKKLYNTTKICYGKYIFDFSKKFNRFTMKEAIVKFNKNINLSDLENLEKTQNILIKLNIKTQSYWKLGHLIAYLFEKTVEKKLIEPTFITEYPIEISPLAKRNEKNNHVTDRFELFIAGYEIGNGFSELNDPYEQKQRFDEQNINKTLNKEEILSYDKDYITALEYGLPPTVGLGIGIDRLVMIFTNQNNIRDVILFPTLRTI